MSRYYLRLARLYYKLNIFIYTLTVGLMLNEL